MATSRRPSVVSRGWRETGTSQGRRRASGGETRGSRVRRDAVMWTELKLGTWGFVPLQYYRVMDGHTDGRKAIASPASRG